MFSTTTTAIITSAALAQLAAGAAVQSLARGNDCLQVSGTPSSGSQVTLGACNSNNAQMTSTGQQWVISSGNNAGVQLYNTNFCLDAQDDTPGGAVIVADCNGSGSQTWYLTGDNRVAITGGTQCLQQGSQVETQNCAPGIDEQAWVPNLLFDTNQASSSAGGVAGGAATASGASGESSVLSMANGLASASSVIGSATSAASAAASSAASGASSVAGAAASGASSVASGAASGASSVASGASSAAAQATSGASSVANQATSGAGSAAGQATSGAGSVAGQATSGAGSVAGQATSVVGSAAGAATSAVGSAGGSSAALPRVALPLAFTGLGAMLAAALVL
ncbi:hypothetical protein IAU60_006337 [Kwoniella sp. DSM 27419]